ncbi:hypothetical protein SISNIDRAFT_464052 [Sistotremastrum niveocremeum HHB9708]|uniref:F-box domain-containing protein n=1 Tax=Sistotremastrum niveocremeum HHB9708 TaxID=1314777 RepID=A0A164Y598_9AGAM|nr:hypothetical protein SISNIDRAFT_464052 [Sistotremastrum niveocremeum HHB9708]
MSVWNNPQEDAMREIFKRLLADSVDPAGNRTWEILKLTAISRRWREIARGSAELWVHAPTTISKEMAALFVASSTKHIELYVRVSHTSPWLSTAFLTKVTHLHVPLWDPYSHHDGQAINVFFPMQLPAVQSLTFHAPLPFLYPNRCLYDSIRLPAPLHVHPLFLPNVESVAIELYPKSEIPLAYVPGHISSLLVQYRRTKQLVVRNFRYMGPELRLDGTSVTSAFLQVLTYVPWRDRLRYLDHVEFWNCTKTSAESLCERIWPEEHSGEVKLFMDGVPSSVQRTVDDFSISIPSEVTDSSL